jgi:hypothetical protein
LALYSSLGAVAPKKSQTISKYECRLLGIWSKRDRFASFSR